MTWNLDVPCDACDAQAGEECRPECAGIPAEFVAPFGAWFDEDSDPWRNR